jgi:hypothetical protein
LFDSETFDKTQKDWNNQNLGIMNGANQALSYIVFSRDKKIFEEKYPNLEIVLQKPLNNYVRYIFSGGLNFKQLLPNICTPILKFIEFIFQPLAPVLALHHVIVIRKKA